MAKHFKADGTLDMRFGSSWDVVNTQVIISAIFVIALGYTLPGLGIPLINGLLAIPFGIIIFGCIIWFIVSLFNGEINLIPILAIAIMFVPAYNIIVTTGWFITNSERTPPLSIEQFEENLTRVEVPGPGTGFVDREIFYEENTITLSSDRISNLTIDDFSDFSLSGFPVGTPRDDRYHYFSFHIYDIDDDDSTTFYSVYGSAVYRRNRAIGYTWGRPRGWIPGEFTFEVSMWPIQPSESSWAGFHFDEAGITDAILVDMIANRKIPPDITALSLSDNLISDITPLQSLSSLTSLRLNGNQISDIAPLQALTELRALNLGDNQISDILPLESLTELRLLNLGDNQVSDIAPLESLTELSVLFLDNNQITDIMPLESLTELSVLNLGHNQISDISPLESLIYLIDLRLYGNQIRDLSPLQRLGEAQGRTTFGQRFDSAVRDATDAFLTRVFGGIVDVTEMPRPEVIRLGRLQLQFNQISDISALESLPWLTSLHLYSNQISDIAPLQSLTELTELRVGVNQISDVAPLISLTQIQLLTLNDNLIRDIASLQSLTQLRGLDLNRNQIVDISPLESLTQLRGLAIRDNQISNATPLQSLSNLETLGISGNPVENNAEQMKLLKDRLPGVDIIP